MPKGIHLSEARKDQIGRAVRAGMKPAALARQFGVKLSTIERYAREPQNGKPQAIAKTSSVAMTRLETAVEKIRRKVDQHIAAAAALLEAVEKAAGE